MRKLIPLLAIGLIDDYKTSNVDAVLMGTKLGATRQIQNFTVEEMGRVQKDIPVIAVYNRFYFEQDMEPVLEELQALKEVGVKELICTDLGIVQLNRTHNLGFRVILDTDTTMTNEFDIEIYLNNGVDEVIVGRELTLEERIYLGENSHNLGMHGFGYQLMSFSRRPHLSAYKKFRSLDLDTSQTYWIKEEKRDDIYMYIEDDYGTHVFAPNVFSILSVYEEIKNSGYQTIILEPRGLDITMVLDITKALDSKINLETLEENLAKDYNITIDSGLLYKKTNQGGPRA